MFKNKELALQFVRFASVGIISLAVDYGFMIILNEATDMGYFRACAFSYTLSILVNYVLSMRYVFRGREDMSKSKEVTIFMVLSLIGLGLNQMAMWLLVDVLGIFYAMAKILAALMVTSYNFISKKTFLE
ncbi:MAG: GtrA family protein [Lachnospiraceae bacterium]|nr:GtrA family protein [Lachnospiraceae bacterium]MBO5098468.1 GtrA family protein [Agathobacter sp.]